MALSQIEIEEILKTLNEINTRYGGLNSAIEAMTKTTLEAQRVGGRNLTDDKNAHQQYLRIMRERDAEEKKILRAQKEQGMTRDETKAAIRELNTKIMQAIPDEFKTNASAYLESQTKKSEAESEYTGTLRSMLLPAIKNTAVGLSKFTLGLVSSYQGASNGLSMALDMGTAGINGLASGVGAVGKGLQIAAPLLLAFGPEMIPVIAGLIELGGVISGASEQFKKIAGDVMPILNREIVNISNSFKTAANAGAVFANGFTGLKNAATDAGLDTKTFSDAIKQNTENISLFGGNVTEGARRIGRVTKLINVEDFQKLGFGLEEIPGIIAQVGATMRRSGNVSDAQVAAATADYAKNLRLIADLTGEDAKTAMAKQDAANRDLAFQQYLSDKTPEQAQAIKNQLALLPEAAQNMAREMIVSGGQLTSDTSNIAAQQVPAYKAMADSFYNIANANQVSSQTGLNILQANAEQANSQLLAARDFARAGSILGGDYKEASLLMLQGRDTLLKVMDPNTFAQLKTDIENAGKTTDPTTKNLATLEQQGMKAMVDLQNTTIAVLKPYMTTITSLNTATLTLIDKFKQLAESTFGPPNAAIGRAVAEGRELNQGQSNDLTRMSPDQLQQLATDNNITTEQLARAAGFNSTDALAQAQENNRQQEINSILAGAGMATGGVASGLNTGYIAKLHGTEAVIPLPDGLDGGDFVNAINTMKTTADNLQSVTSRSTDTSRMENLLEKLTNQMAALIDHTQNVAGNTELTAQRIM